MTHTSSQVVRYVADHARLPIPQDLDWLTSNERTEFEHWKHAARRQQWLAGRWIAKRLISRQCEPARLAEVEVLTRDAEGLGTAPRISICGNTAAIGLSISHAGSALLVAACHGQKRIGVDLVTDVPNNDSFRTSWFTQHENNWIAESPRNRLPIAWGLKEAIFKACGTGEKWHPGIVSLIEIERNMVRYQIAGANVASLSSWLRSSAQGTAAVVWDNVHGKEVALCS
ncbi:4'-phosphopantetheinyl transferase superfamily protein [bacterium]|nr:4'-phosphopantetheinyl transferase superfamily protein [bacterium]